MLCRDPFVQGSSAFPCGRCEPCLINRSRLWTHRIILESAQYTDNVFITLTYRDESLPLSSAGLPTLAPEDVRNWLKRFRKAIEPLRVRFYLVGEYGDETFRPHYHVALFGYPACLFGQTRPTGKLRRSCCIHCDLVRDTWARGQVYLGRLEEKSAQYIAGYVVKKMFRRDDVRLLGREPEFSRMSNRRGLGFSAMHEVASQLMVFNLDTSQADVPSALRHGKKVLPLGRYLRRALRQMVGKDASISQEAFDELQARVLPVLQASVANKVSFKEALKSEDTQKVLSMLARRKLHKGRKSL